MEDAELVVAAQGGDTDAFGELVKRYERLVSAVAIAGLSGKAMVDDVVQDSFVAAWVHRDSLKDPNKFRPWICGIARNLASKSRRFDSKFVNQEKLADSATASPNAEDHLLRMESENALSCALQEIPVDQREVLVLFYREEQSVRDVSQALGLSEMAVQKRISRARKSVKTQMNAVLEKGLRSPVTRLSVGAGVLAIINSGGEAAAAVSATASHAATISAANLSTQVIGGILTMKTIVPAAAALILLIGGAVAYSNDLDSEASSPDAEVSEPVKAAKNAAQKSALPKAEAESGTSEESASVTSMRRIDAEERAARFAKFKHAAALRKSALPKKSSAESRPELKSNLSTKDMIRGTIREVLPLVRECYEMSEGELARASSNIVATFKISNEPEIAGLVTEVSMARQGEPTIPVSPEFAECMEETFMSLEFTDLDRELSVSYPFRFSKAVEEENSDTEQ